MAYDVGWSAVNLEIPDRIPRTEYSVHTYHYALMERVTGIRVDNESPEHLKRDAGAAFVKAWNYDIFQGAFIGRNEFGELQTNMGHAEYAAGGTDFDANLRHPFDSTDDVFRFDPWQAYGERDKRDIVRRIENCYADRQYLYPECVNITGIYITLVTGLTLIFGWELLLLAAGEDPGRLGQTVNRYADWILQYYEALAETKLSVVLSHDDIVWTEGAIFQPAWYRRYVFPNFEKLWQPLRVRGKKILFVSDGNYTNFAADIAACGNDGFWFEIFTDLGHMVRNFGKSHFLIGNGDCRVLLYGSREAIRAEVRRCVDSGRECPGYVMAVTNHIPANIPVENALCYNRAYEEFCMR